MVSVTNLACHESFIPVTNDLDREYVRSYWPNPDTSAYQLRDMFEKLVIADRVAEEQAQDLKNGTIKPDPSAQAAQQ